MKHKSAAALLLALCSVGCIDKQAAPVSTWERVNVNLAALAQINESVAKGIIAVQDAGTITAQQAAPVLEYQELVAKDHVALEHVRCRINPSDEPVAPSSSSAERDQKPGNELDPITRGGD